MTKSKSLRASKQQRPQNTRATYKPTPLDEELFKNLLSVLTATAFGGKLTKAARALSVSTPTIKRWKLHPPQQAYWNIVLEHTIRDVQRFYRNSSRSIYRDRAKDIQDAMMLIDRPTEIDESPADHPDNAITHLLTILTEHPAHEMPVSKIRLNAHNGGYSYEVLNRAAKNIGLRRRTVHNGEHKETYWSLPKRQIGSTVVSVEKESLYEPEFNKRCIERVRGHLTAAPSTTEELIQTHGEFSPAEIAGSLQTVAFIRDGMWRLSAEDTVIREPKTYHVKEWLRGYLAVAPQTLEDIKLDCPYRNLQVLEDVAFENDDDLWELRE